METIETAWKHFQQNQKFRMDLDSRVPYLGEDENGELIEPTAQQMKELYQEIGRPQQKDDIGEEGFVNAYYGAVVLKRLLVYTYIPLNVATHMKTCKYLLRRRDGETVET